MTKTLLFLLSMILPLLAFPSQIVMACGSYNYLKISELSLMDLWVKATVIDTDDRGHNAILRVEEYYKGEGGQLLTVIRYPIALETGHGVRGYPTGCLYSGQGTRWRKGTQGYFGFVSNGDGTFTDVYDSIGTAHFYAWDGEITEREGATGGYAIDFIPPNIILEEDFIAQLLEIGGHDTPLQPTIAEVQLYPLMRYLNITTENGTRYQISPVRTVQQLSDNAPLAISPDGSHVAFKVDDETVTFQYIWSEYQYNTPHSGQDFADPNVIEQYKKQGELVRFSNDSNMVAVWDTVQLTVYMFDNIRPEGHGNRLRIKEITIIDLDAQDVTSANVMWSADSSTLAWEASNGVWLWNLFDDAEPMHITDAPGLLDLSTYGRYVRIGKPYEWMLFDTQTQETFANTIASPSEQFLIFVNRNETTITDWQTSEDCKPLLRDNCAMYVEPTFQSDIVTIFPYQMELLGVMGCTASDADCILEGISWHPSVGQTLMQGGGRYIGRTRSDIRQVEYDIFYDQIAILTGDYQIEFDFYYDYSFEEDGYLPYLDYLNLDDELDSPIATIEWGQPIFYDTFMLTATQYLP